MKTKGMRAALICLGLLVLNGCSDKQEDNKTEEGSSQDVGLQPPVSSESQKTEVDATSRTDFLGFDLDKGIAIPVTELAANADWDLAFKRTSVKMNGEQVKMQVIAGKSFEDVVEAPATGYAADQVSTDPAATETSGLAFHQDTGWYAYDINTHVVSSQSKVYVIQSNEGRYFKLRFLDYYNVERLPAYINFEWQEVKAPQQLTGVK